MAKDRTIYINWRSQYGLETVDQFSKSEHPQLSNKQFRQYVNDMVDEYNLAYGGGCYKSQRCTKGWKE